MDEPLWITIVIGVITAAAALGIGAGLYAVRGWLANGGDEPESGAVVEFPAFDDPWTWALVACAATAAAAVSALWPMGFAS